MSEQADYSEHLFSYSFDGAIWGFSIMAKSEDDAKHRLKALAWAKYDGEIMARIPAVAGSGLLVRGMVGLRNIVARKGRK